MNLGKKNFLTDWPTLLFFPESVDGKQTIWSKSSLIKNCFGELSFDLSLQTGIYSEPLKIAKVTTVFKIGDLREISNYRQISVLPCFSKVLERIMYSRLYSYLVNEKILYSKQFGFQKGHSTEHVIAELADQISWII